VVVHIAKLHNFVLVEVPAHDDLHLPVQFVQIVVVGLQQVLDFADEGGVVGPAVLVGVGGVVGGGGVAGGLGGEGEEVTLLAVAAVLLHLNNSGWHINHQASWDYPVLLNIQDSKYPTAQWEQS